MATDQLLSPHQPSFSAKSSTKPVPKSIVKASSASSLPPSTFKQGAEAHTTSIKDFAWPLLSPRYFGDHSPSSNPDHATHPHDDPQEKEAAMQRALVVYGAWLAGSFSSPREEGEESRERGRRRERSRIASGKGKEKEMTKRKEGGGLVWKGWRPVWVGKSAG